MCKKTMPADRKDYLTSFLRDFEFSAESRGVLEEAYDLIFADKASVRLYEKIRRRFEKKPDERFSYLIQTSERIAERCAISRFTAYMVVLILLTESTKKIYAERNVSPEMWRKNMLDLRYKCDHCILVKGVYGTECPEWYDRFFAATRFTFGKLQFETDRLGKDYEKDGLVLHPDNKVIFIHIPRTGQRLLPEDVDVACREASAFFKQRYGMQDVVFACHSWILYPENKKIMSETSNLYSFISRFEIIDVVEENVVYKEAWRLFDKEYHGDADVLPQDTSLRRAYAQRIKAHEPLGVALGVWVYERKK